MNRAKKLKRERRYSVICSGRDHKERIEATGLDLVTARAISARLDREYRDAVEGAGRHYSSWTADLHFCQLESSNMRQPNAKI